MFTWALRGWGGGGKEVDGGKGGWGFKCIWNPDYPVYIVLFHVLTLYTSYSTDL